MISIIFLETAENEALKKRVPDRKSDTRLFI